MRPEEAELVTESKVLQLLEVAREAYDLVVVDTSPFFYGPMLAVLRPDRQAAAPLRPRRADAQEREAEPAHARACSASRRRARSLVLNRVTPNVGLTKEDVEGALGLAVASRFRTIRSSRRRSTAARRRHSPTATREFAEAIALIAHSLEPAESDGSPFASRKPRSGAGQCHAASSKGGHHEPRRPAPGRSERREQRPPHRAHPGRGRGGDDGSTPRGRAQRYPAFPTPMAR